MSYDVIVIGAGASGMMAAAFAAGRGRRTLLIEKKSEPGKKLLITGKGRCNVTNNCDVGTVMKNVVSNPKFLYSALNSFSPSDTMSFFEELGIELKTERGNRVFPASDKSSDIANALAGLCKKNGVKLTTDTVTEIVSENGAVCGVRTTSGKAYEAESVIIATGGLSYPGTGSTGDGYKFAKKLGHSIVSPRPSLVALRIKGNECQQMQGLSLRNTGIMVVRKANGKCVYSDMGEMLFTHFGVSGPIILSASARISDFPAQYELSIDLKPALSPEKLDQRISRDFSENINRDFSNSLGALLPRALIPVIVNRSGIGCDKKVNQITRAQRLALCNIIKDFRLEITGTEGIETAVITAGGVSTDEINPSTMQSKIVKGLYFTGEVIDVDACTGGFNLQIAFSTGRAAGINA